MKIEKKIDIPVKNGMIWNVRWGTCPERFEGAERPEIFPDKGA